MLKKIVMLFVVMNGTALMAQDRQTYNGQPSVHYQGSKYGSLFASITQHQGNNAIVYEIGFQPGRGWGVSGILSGGKTAYFGKLYVTADKVAFVAARDNDQKLNWTMTRSDFSLAMTKDGMEIIPSSKDRSDTPKGLLHFQPIENKTGKLEFDKPNEPTFLHKGHLDAAIESFLNDFNGAINSFNETYKRLAAEAGVA